MYLYHLGDICTPSLIINELLNIKEKSLFMLGTFKLDGITSYLSNNKLEEIYDIGLYDISSINNNFFIHKKYNIELNHDFKIDSNNTIINNDKVIARFKEKINNWENMCNSEESVIFLHMPFSVNIKHIIDFMDVMKLHKKKGKVFMVCLSPNTICTDVRPHPNVSIKKLNIQRSLYSWDFVGIQKRNIIKEQYDLFLEALSDLSVSHTFPEFDKTPLRNNFAP